MLFGKRRIKRLVDGAQGYIEDRLERPEPPEVRFSRCGADCGRFSASARRWRARRFRSFFGKAEESNR